MAVFIAIGVAVAAVALTVLFMPKPKAPKPAEATDLESPVAEAGKPIPVIFGTVTVKGLNVLWYGDKHTYTKKIKA
jgi:hypothetical protein